MKILTLVFSIGPGGTERAAVNYAVAYRRSGHESRVLVAGEGYDRLGELEQAGVECILAKRSGRPLEDILLSLQQWQPDIIHLHNYCDDYLPYLEKIRVPHTRVVETNVFSRPHHEAGYRQVDLSLQLSHWGLWKYQHWMRGAAWIPAQAVVPYIVIGEHFTAPTDEAIRQFRHRHGIPDGAFVAGRIGQAHPSKWDIRLLDIAESTIRRDNNTWFFLVGLPEFMRTALQKRPPLMRSRIVLLDVIRGDQELSLYYHSLQCLVHLSAIGESFGYVLAEALSCRVPVITLLTPFRDNAQYEVVGHQQGGYCCTHVQECADALIALQRSPALCAEIRARLPEWVDDRFGPDAVMPRLTEHYRRLLSGEMPAVTDPTPLVKEVCRKYGWKGAWLYPALMLYHHRLTYLLLQWFKKRPV